ncbi:MULTISPECIES: ribosomal protein S18-alanine N-acetyltransferase [Aerococcus]|nr:MULTISPECIES: ribosomal protein S18-alanine N-acetyltransferase [Aerococcus]MDK6369623.1 ribosomal protein S18-alanine N-acetyltransferase [Aerococcus sp. UMB9870]MDK6686289.1 ribosomal protein S18-alanine N-acetyltransferase [Aerococcus sp. UMB8623]
MMGTAMLKERINRYLTWMNHWFSPGKEDLLDRIDIQQAERVLPSGLVVSLRLSDQTALKQMVELEKLAYGQVMWQLKDFYQDMVGRSDTCYLQAFINGSLLGFIACREEADHLHVSNFMVDPTWQGQGLGSYLLEEARQIAQQLDLTQIQLEVRQSNTAAQAFYRARGFSRLKTRRFYYHDNHEHADLLAWRWEEGEDKDD